MNGFKLLERRFDGDSSAPRSTRRAAIAAPALDLTMEGNRSMSPQSARATVMVVAGVMALGVVRALVFGAWPIALFLVADILLFAGLMLAFVHRPPPRERLAIANGRLLLEQFWPGGARLDAAAALVRLDMLEAASGEPHLHLRLHGRRFAIAAMLSPDERRDVADLVRSALQAA